MASRLHIRCSRQMKEGLEELSQKYDTDISTLVRSRVRGLIRDKQDDLPEHIVLDSVIEGEKAKVESMQKALHIPNNFHEETTEMLWKRYPPTPKEVELAYVKPYKETMKHVFTDDKDIRERKTMQIQHTFENYKRLHPDGNYNHKQVFEAAVNMAMQVRQQEDMETAKGFIKKLVNDGVIPDRQRDELFDTVREMAVDEWRESWKDNVGHIHAGVN